MLILISPAKTLDYQSPLATERYTPAGIAGLLATVDPRSA